MTKIGLVFNEMKNKIIIMTRNPGEFRNFKTGDQNFEEIDEFVYLRPSIRTEGNTTAIIKRLIISTNICYYCLSKQLSN